MAREADLIIGIGTRYSDFTSASKTAFQNPAVRFININVFEFDAHKPCPPFSSPIKPNGSSMTASIWSWP